ncbi:MAG TPA: hypothetical protein VGG41_17130 [Solirubrobacteraceae bacterium]|jgi:hypothetical protein
MRTILGSEIQLREEGDAEPKADPEFDSAIDSNKAFVEHGEALRSRLVAFVHGDDALRRADRRAARAWQRTAFKISRGPNRG